jgi:hypothetical protein
MITHHGILSLGIVAGTGAAFALIHLTFSVRLSPLRGGSS